MEREKIKIKTELGNELENSENMIAFDTPEIEKKPSLNQQETEKLEKTKTEEPVNYTENQTVADLKKKISELKNQVLEKDQAIEEYRDRMKGLEKEIHESKIRVWMDTQSIKEMKDTLAHSALSSELLRQKNTEANRMAEELRRKISACEDEKKISDWIINDMKRRGSENVLYMEDLRRQNLEASKSLKELRRRISAYEGEKKMVDQVLEEMKRRESENIRYVEDLRRQNLEANQRVDELGDRILACEESKIMADRFREEMEVRESELRLQLSRAEQTAKEMELRELDLRRQLSRAEQSAKEMKERGLEACTAAEVNMKRFGNVVPIAEELCKLLRMNVEDLVSVKDKFVSTESGNGATTTHREEGGAYASKAMELTIFDQSTKSKKRYSEETQTTPSSAAEIINIIDCDDVEYFVKGSKLQVVEANKSPIERKVIFGADMVKAFMEDDELCLHAVCALYRRHVSTSESAECPSRLFYHFEALRGRALADYLIDGDPELSLTRSVDQVKQRNPGVVNQCRRLAICYSSYFTAMPRTHGPPYRSFSLELVSDV